MMLCMCVYRDVFAKQIFWLVPGRMKYKYAENKRVYKSWFSYYKEKILVFPSIIKSVVVVVVVVVVITRPYWALLHIDQN